MNHPRLFFILILPVIILKVIPSYSPEQLTFSAEKTGISDDGDPVKIGLLVPDNKSLSALRAAELAVNMANQAGGLKGRPFRLVVRSLEGPWGTGSKQAIDLIFNEKVWALIGSHDGRNAHLVEQAATKATVVFLSCWAGDPSLSQAFVPWFFNCVYNDDQQASGIVSLLEGNYGKIKITALTDNDDYDSRVSFASLKKFLDKSDITTTLILEYRNYKDDIKSLTKKIIETAPDYLLLYCRPEISSDILHMIRNFKINQHVISPAYIMNEDVLAPSVLSHLNNFVLIPSDKWTDSAYETFKADYEENYGTSPGLVASYMYDGMNVLIEAIRKANSPDREKIQKALYEIDYKGITGRIRFDQKGNRTGTLKLLPTVSGIPTEPMKATLPE